MSAQPAPPLGPGAQAVRLSFWFIAALAVLAACAWASSNIRRIPADSRAVVMRFGALVRTQDAGLVIAWPRPFESVRLVPGAALAASVALLAVALWWWQPGGDLVRMQGGQSFAAGDLTRALDETLASEPKANAPVAIGLSFRSTDGRICRTFVLRSPPARAGLACRSDAGWALPVLSAVATPEGGGELRQAASALPPAVQAAVDARLRGNVFDARQERAARDAGWR